MIKTNNLIQETGIRDLLVVNPKIIRDKRGYFYESYNHNTFKELGLNYNFVQDNEALSTYGVLRGLHFQLQPKSQTKLIRVPQGKVLDVVVDIRSGSPTYGEHFSIILSGENKKQLLVPQGFAHGYVVLSDTAVFSYKCDNFYARDLEGGLAFNDPALNIDWQLAADQLIISDKDAQWSNLADLEHNFVY